MSDVTVVLDSMSSRRDEILCLSQHREILFRFDRSMPTRIATPINEERLELFLCDFALAV